MKYQLPDRARGTPGGLGTQQKTRFDPNKVLTRI